MKIQYRDSEAIFETAERPYAKTEKILFPLANRMPTCDKINMGKIGNFSPASCVEAAEMPQ